MRRARAIAIAFAFAWLVVLVAGADHPPPLGFLVLLPLVALAAAGVYQRAIVYAGWKARHQPRSTLRAMAEGALAGLAFAAAFRLLPWVGEPGVRLSAGSFLVWLGVTAAIGALGALLVYLLAGGHASGSQSSGRP